MERWLLRLWGDPTYGALMRVGLAQLLVLAGVVVSVASIRLRRQQDDQVRRAAQQAAEVALLGLLSGEFTEAEAAAAMQRLPRAHLIQILERYTGALAGASRETLQGLYGALGLQRYALGLLRSWFWWRRLEGVRLLAAMSLEVGRPRLLAMLRDPNESVRLAAARALAQSRDAELMPPLLDALAGLYHISRRQLAEALVEAGPMAWPVMRQRLERHPEDEGQLRLHTTILEVLALSGDLQSAGVIERALVNPEVELRIAGFKSAMLLHLNLEPATLRQGLRDDRWEVRAQAARACGHAGHAALVPELGVALSHEEWWVRFNAARALDRLGPEGRRELERVVYQGVDHYARDAALQVLTEDPAYAELYAYRVELAQSSQSPAQAMLEAFLEGASEDELLSLEEG
jgi:HEAT repeat protein